ncbi:hypothetical protein Droror1_Dr00005852 [Drosera rotundifolia]
MASQKRIASKKRAAKDPRMKKRAVLEDITNRGIGDGSPSNMKRKRVMLRETENGVEETRACEVGSSDGSDGEEMEMDCGACGSAVYQRLRALELERKPSVPNYMEKIQEDVTAYMREILVDWLVEVTEDYSMVSDTLYLTVSYIDIFLSLCSIKRTKLQLLGVSCMLVASKYEEVCPLHVEKFCYVTDNTFTQDEVEDMERNVERLLNYETSSPTAKTFLRIFMRAAQQDYEFSNIKFEVLASYLAELSLLDYECVCFLPSVVAASAIFLARFTIRPVRCPWTLALEKCSGYQPSMLKECVLAIHELQLGRRRTSAKALRQRYMDQKFEKVASLRSPPTIPSGYFKDILKSVKG